MVTTVTGPTRGQLTVVVVCDCGQELDRCEREHCPRCGRATHHAG